jgi:hypothetical protein
MNITEDCTGCVYFVLREQQSKYEEGRCRRFPPDDRGLQPLVSKFHWCGEYRAKPIVKKTTIVQPKQKWKSV